MTQIPTVEAMIPKDKAVIFDLDGTLCDVQHRLHLLPKKDTHNHEDYYAFHELAHKDKMNYAVASILWMSKSFGYKIILVTCRDDKYRKQTENWLDIHNIKFDKLFMRIQNNYMSDAEYKEYIYSAYIQLYYNVLFVIDDRKGVVAKWRELGLFCLQCDGGDYRL